MKSILMSIKPKYCDLIASGNKTIEVRKTKPKVKTPFNCYIYECKGKEIFKSMEIPKGYGEGYIDFYEFEGRGKIIGEFVCDEIQILFNTNGNPKNYMKDILPNILKKSQLSYDEFSRYVGSRASRNNIYGWHISNLVIYDKPKDLSEFRKPCRFNHDCYVCNKALFDKRVVTDRDGKTKRVQQDFIGCNDVVIKPPQSWCYVESEES